MPKETQRESFHGTKLDASGYVFRHGAIDDSTGRGAPRSPRCTYRRAAIAAQNGWNAARAQSRCGAVRCGAVRGSAVTLGDGGNCPVPITDRAAVVRCRLLAGQQNRTGSKALPTGRQYWTGSTSKAAVSRRTGHTRRRADTVTAETRHRRWPGTAEQRKDSRH